MDQLEHLEGLEADVELHEASNLFNLFGIWMHLEGHFSARAD